MKNHNRAVCVLMLVAALSACETDGAPKPTTTSQAAVPAASCGGPMETARAVADADPDLKFPTEASAFCFPQQSRITLYKPANAAAKAPAVIVLPTCYAMSPYIYRWMETFTQAGYVVLGLDYYTPRGIKSNCHPYGKKGDKDLAKDVAAAVTHLKSLAFVDGERIGVVGYSLGGTVALHAIQSGAPAKVAATVAFYPPLTMSADIATARLPEKLQAPALVLYGSNDAESPHTPALVKKAAEAGNPIELKSYAGAHHSFDDPTLRSPRRRQVFGFNVIDQYDDNAARQAREDTLSFLAKHLKPNA